MSGGTALTSFRRWLESLVGFVYPPVCGLCHDERASAFEGYMGPRCRRRICPMGEHLCARCGLPMDGETGTIPSCANCREMTLHFESARAIIVANETFLELIHRYKYQGQRWFEPYLFELIATGVVGRVQPGEWDMVVPVPLHPVKLREREFNQAEVLGRQFSRATGIPLRSELIFRARATGTQTHLSRAERSENVTGAFAAAGDSRLDGCRCIVFDDVLTTGATTNAVAQVLRGLGASRVSVWSLGRAVF